MLKCLLISAHRLQCDAAEVTNGMLVYTKVGMPLILPGLNRRQKLSWLEEDRRTAGIIVIP
jgi:hypothetical protein